MPSGQLFTVVGDANVRRNMTSMNMASREAMASARVIDCKELSAMAQCLREVPADSTVCLVQSITSFLVSASFSGTVFGTIDPILTEFAQQLRGFCQTRPSIQVLVAPPMYQFTPFWYRRHLPEVSQQFSAIFSQHRVRNLSLLSSPISQDLCDDGVHLTPVAGLHYLLNLFDDAQRVLTAMTSKGSIAYYYSYY